MVQRVGMKVNADKCGHHHKVQVAICASIHLCSLVNVLVVWYRKAPPVQVDVMTPWVQVEYLQYFDGRKQHQCKLQRGTSRSGM